MDMRGVAFLAALGATTIYALNHTIAKVIMPNYIGAFGLVLLRVIGATILFWIASLFVKSEKIEFSDYPRLLIASIFGMCVNMLAFIKGLSLSTPINGAVIVTLTPLFVLIISTILIKEKITFTKFGGIILGFSGAVTLIAYGNSFTLNAPNIPLGNMLMVCNALSFGTYLVISKPLVKKYSTITLMKWMFPLGVLYNLPFTLNEFILVDWFNLPFHVIWRMGFVVICTTFLAYLFNMFALQYLKATTISSFTYFQPIIAVGYASITGNDKLDWIKFLSCLMVFCGVYLVTKRGEKKKFTANNS